MTLAASATPNVYIAVRTDGAAGTGTQADPFDGSTQPKFDALMAGIPANTQINLLAGTFLTYGADVYAMKSGWIIKGAGMGVTIVKLAGHVSPYHKHVNFGSDWVANDEISDLTCDGNDQGYNWPAHDAVGGIALWGTNSLLKNIEVINCYGDNVDQQEQFSLLVTGRPDGLASNNAIENCVVHQYAPGSTYTNGPMISYTNGALISGCTDDGSNHGFGFAGTINARITGCSTTAKTNDAFYTDTGSNSDLTIEQNTLIAAQIPIQFNAQPAEEDVKILNNTLKSYNSTGSGNAAIVLSGASGNNFEINGNVYAYAGTAHGGLILNNNKLFTDLDIEDNSSNVGLVGSGGTQNSVTDVATSLAGNKFNEPLADLAENDPEQTPAATQDAPASSTAANTPPAPAATPATAPAPSSPASNVASNTASVFHQAAFKPASGPGNRTVSTAPAQALHQVGGLNVSRMGIHLPQSVLSTWVKKDPAGAAQYVQSMTDGPEKQTALQVVAEQWESTDPAGATNWLASLPESEQTTDLYNAAAEKWAENHPSAE